MLSSSSVKSALSKTTFTLERFLHGLAGCSASVADMIYPGLLSLKGSNRLRIAEKQRNNYTVSLKSNNLFGTGVLQR